jgi:hypothetical protein
LKQVWLQKAQESQNRSPIFSHFVHFAADNSTLGVWLRVRDDADADSFHLVGDAFAVPRSANPFHGERATYRAVSAHLATA